MLEGMGFPTLRCKKALLATGNSGDAQAAMEWLFVHMEDPGTYISFHLGARSYVRIVGSYFCLWALKRIIRRYRRADGCESWPPRAIGGAGRNASRYGVHARSGPKGPSGNRMSSLTVTTPMLKQADVPNRFAV
jgi:hypothetical protein